MAENKAENRNQETEASLMPLTIDGLHDLGAAGKVGAKDTFHGRGDHAAARFFHATNRHAAVRCFNHHGHALGTEFFDQQIGNVLGHSLLDLRAVRNHFDDAGNLRKSNDFTVGDIGDVGGADKGQEVVFAHAAKADVANQNDFVIVFR